MICINHPRYRGVRRTARSCIKCKLIRTLYHINEFFQPDMSRVLKRLDKQRAKKERAPEYRKFLFCGGPADGQTLEIPTVATCWFVGSVKYTRRSSNYTYFAPANMHSAEADAIYENLTTPLAATSKFPEPFKESQHVYTAEPKDAPMLFVGGPANGLKLEVPIGIPQYNYHAGNGGFFAYFLQRDVLTDTYFFALGSMDVDEARAAYGALKLSQEPA